MEPLMISGPAGQIESVIHRVSDSKQWAVICHPHPLFGGTMNNKVVTTLSKVYKRLGINAVRFNFRGIGKSDGEYGEGAGETLDALAVVEHIRRHESVDQLFLAGFSFGSYVAAQTAHDLSNGQTPVVPEHLLLVAPSVENFPYDKAEPLTYPTTVVIAEADEVVSVPAAQDWVGQLYPPAEIIEMEGASHFFHGRLIELRDRLKESLSEHI